MRRKLAQLTRGAFTVFRATPIEMELIISRNPLDAWDITAVAGQYESFVRRWSPPLRRTHRGSVRGAEAVRIRTEVMDIYRRFSIRSCRPGCCPADGRGTGSATFSPACTTAWPDPPKTR